MTVEAFDGIQIKTIENVAFLLEHGFGASEKYLKFYPKFAEQTATEMTRIAVRIHTLTKFANSINPESMREYKIRRRAQKKARALVYSLEGQYHSALAVLKVDNNKWVDHIRHIKHQANCIKSWISKDRSMYKKREWWVSS